ncbi:hypothetical protein HMPREF9578_01873 [Cutibacterium acnes HL110PA4]|nr:hypothetical protein HMPREF9206_0202 [Cutibacterium acnes J139]EFT62789.1 hypothetical protein HMPREF9578_01873 [Cutibacterium acnes HL110PA4]
MSQFLSAAFAVMVDLLKIIWLGRSVQFCIGVLLGFLVNDTTIYDCDLYCWF